MHIFKALGAVCLGAASRILKSKIKATAAAVVVGIGLLAGSIGNVQAACDPPVYDVCFHKDSGNWTTAGEAVMYVDFDVPSSKAGTAYRIVWWGYQDFFGFEVGEPDFGVVTRWGSRSIVDFYSGDGNELSNTFKFDPARNSFDDPFIYDSYGVAIYEHNLSTGKDIKWVASVDFRPGQAAAYVSVDSEYYSDLSVYYCTIDWDPTPLSGLRSGYYGPFWQDRWYLSHRPLRWIGS